MTNTDMSLRDAAQAVIDRWETPLWKDAPATAVFIADLRDALARDAGRASMQFPGFSAEDMATASAQGFRDGVASLSAAEPAGWKIVPVVPTQEMLDAVVTTMDDFLLGKEAEKQYREDWAAMLAATPALTQGADIAAGAAERTGCTAGTDEECTRRGCATNCHALRASHGQAPAQPQHIEAMERAWLWMENQADGQSKGGQPCDAERAGRARLLDSDLSNLTERGAHAWAGVDAQKLREGGRND